MPEDFSKIPCRLRHPRDPSLTIEPGVSIALVGHEICTDFESLLFQGRAALDRLTRFVAAEYNQDCDRYSKLGNVLSNFADSKAKVALSVLKEAPSLASAFVDAEGQKALRARVAHRSSLLEGVSSVFTLHCIENGKILILDCESFGMPVFETTFTLSEDLPFVINNLVGIYLGMELCPSNILYLFGRTQPCHRHAMSIQRAAVDHFQYSVSSPAVYRSKLEGWIRR